MGRNLKENLLSLYIHIPFCVRKCLYCDFLSGPAGEETISQYVEALVTEIRLAGSVYGTGSPDGKIVDSIFFGGGTPTLLSEKQFDHICAALYTNFLVSDDAEITTECNPGTASAPKLSALRKMGINRISFGVQSFLDPELRALGRIHSGEEALAALRMAEEAGFTEISSDLMSGIPGQTQESLLKSIGIACESGLTHLSVYSLIVEPGTPYYARYGEREKIPASSPLSFLPDLPDEDTERRMYYKTRDFLREHGFCRYEISNYALPGHECRHNLGYWTEHPYLGFGVGAASLVFTEAEPEGIRFRNTKDLETYRKAMQSGALSDIRRERQTRSIKDAMEEYMFLGLRTAGGIGEEAFRQRFGKTVRDVYRRIPDRHIAEGLLTEKDGRLFLTDRGIDVSNSVMADYIF